LFFCAQGEGVEEREDSGERGGHPRREYREY